MMVRWPARIQAGQVSNEIIAMMDWMPTLLAAAGNDKIKAELKAGARVGGKSYKVHLWALQIVIYRHPAGWLIY
jgi:arylsulfatase